MAPIDTRSSRNNPQQQNVELKKLRLTLIQRLKKRPKTSEDSIVFPIQPSNGFYGSYEYIPKQIKNQELQKQVTSTLKDMNETAGKAKVNQWVQLGIYLGVCIPCLILIYIPIHLLGRALGFFKFPLVILYYLLWFVICFGISYFAAYVADSYRQSIALKRGNLLKELIKEKNLELKGHKAKIVLSKDLSWYQVRLNVRDAGDFEA